MLNSGMLFIIKLTIFHLGNDLYHLSICASIISCNYTVITERLCLKHEYQISVYIYIYIYTYMYVAYTNCLYITVVIVCACYSEKLPKKSKLLLQLLVYLYTSTHERYNKL